MGNPDHNYLNDVSMIAVKEEDGKNIIHSAVKSSYQRAVIGGGKTHLLDPDLEDALYTARNFAFNNALVIFAADGIFSDQEKRMAYDFAEKWNYRTDYVDQMIQAAASGRL